jgi:hypothetical protein
MLLVPGDSLGRQRLERLGARDWQTVLGLARLLQATVEQAGASLAAHWPVVASRLLVQLQSLRPRLRYDQLDVELDTEHQDQSPQLTLRLEGLSYGERTLNPVQIRWRPRAARHRLVWQLDGEGVSDAPLATWPTRSDGSLETELALPVGPGFGRLQRMRWWATLPAVDRDLLLALLDALPAAVQRLDGAPPAKALPAGLNSAALLNAAHGMRTDAKRSVTAGRLGLAVYGALRGRRYAAG